MALQETPTDEHRKKRKALDECHILIWWLELQILVKEHMACAQKSSTGFPKKKTCASATVKCIPKK
jgi:hypothetical protein